MTVRPRLILQRMPGCRYRAAMAEIRVTGVSDHIRRPTIPRWTLLSRVATESGVKAFVPRRRYYPPRLAC